jgi:hypothetical protein
MGQSYRQCTECGKRALRIATRCPGCGHEFPDPAVPESGPAVDLGRFLLPSVVAGVLAAAAVLTSAKLGRASRLPEQPPSLVAADSVAAFSEVAYAMAATAPLHRASAAGLLAESAGELLVARSWTSVRQSRRKSAPLEAVLTPGDTVLADSLERGWYRVALEGEVLGYAHRSTLTPPEARTAE